LQIDTSKINATSGEEYYMGSPSLSQKTVVVTGPEQSVSKVDKAIVSAELEGELVETTVLEKLSVQLVDAQGNEITDDSLVVDPVTVDVTIPVLMKKTVPLKLDYSHAPSEFSADGFITIEPSELEIAAAADVIDSVEYISIGTLDFNSLSYGASAMSFELVMPEGVKNFNSIEKANVKFDFTNYSTKSFVVNDFDFINTPSGFAAEYSTYRNIVVRVVGPQTSISNLKASEVSTVIDLSDAKSGTTDMPVQVYINKATDCWVFGTYTMNVTVKEASEVSSTLTSAVSSAAESGVKSTDNDQ
ncbi:MAG: hypothetical protein II685_07125, partial [Clostridia bacterium]|nr:hypothetical protein [Clostridia bacterium]